MNIENYIDCFFEPGISVIVVDSTSEYCPKFKIFYKYLIDKQNSTIIKENEPHYFCKNTYIIDTMNIYDIVSILKPIKNQSVFIPTSLNNWVMPISSDVVARANHFTHAFRKFHTICTENNINLILMQNTYVSNSLPMKTLPNGMTYASNLIVTYKDELFHIIKNRFDKEKDFNIDEILQPIIKENRTKKLKRILV